VKPDKQFENLLLKSPVSFDQETLSGLNDYLLLIKHWSKKMNLVSYTDRKDVFVKHFIPSFWFYETIKSEKPQLLLDIGTGAGFPGMIIKILNPQIDVYLVESNKKKTLFLREAAEEMDIVPKIINNRIESFMTETNKTFDVIVSRAVTSLKETWNWSNNLIAEKGSVFVIKGRDYKNELDQVDSTDIQISEIAPEPKWVASSPELKNKLIIKMEKA
jgi:16S rRNA (guanine527-N7)-methyltransferase